MAIQVTDFFVVKRQALDIPALHQPHGRYRYWYGINWRALEAMLCSVAPQLPGLVNAVSPSLPISGAVHIANMNWYFGIFSYALVYAGPSAAVPAQETLLLVLYSGRDCRGRA